MTNLPKTLLPPSLPAGLPEGAQWLAGEGAGSWFVIKNGSSSGCYKVSRFSPKGRVECVSEFKAVTEINLEAEFKITFPTHCARVTIIQFNSKIKLLPTS